MVINKCSVTTRSAAVVDIICFLKLTKCVDAAVQPNCDFFVFNTKERKKSRIKRSKEMKSFAREIGAITIRILNESVAQNKETKGAGLFFEK